MAVLDGLELLGYWHRLANAARLDHYVVELAGAYDVLYVLRHLGLEGAAYAAISEWDDAAGVGYIGSFGYQLLVYVNLANVVDDDSHLETLLIVKNLVQQGGLASSQISA